MRIAVLSDIHSNLAALQAVRDDLPPIDEIWVLGDIVGYGPQPNEVIRALQQMGARSVWGVARRLLSGGDYPGLAELIGEFYGAVATSGTSPVSPDHLT